jgi:beta-alanine--pyruvate transaminase
MLAGVDHLRHTHDLDRNAFSAGLPKHGAELADDLERLVALHGADTIAAVIVEPVAGATGVLLPPEGYLARLRDICTRNGILLIFDEVITGFGRMGAPFAAQRFDVMPDLICAAKGLTNGVIPMGAVLAARAVYDGLMIGPENAIELFHGYTYSAHPVACAAGLATLDIYEREGLLGRALNMERVWEEELGSLRDMSSVIDVRCLGLIAGIEIAPDRDRPGARGAAVFAKAFENGFLVRAAGDTIALSPPLVIEPSQIGELIRGLRVAIETL